MRAERCVELACTTDDPIWNGLCEQECDCTWACNSECLSCAEPDLFCSDYCQGSEDFDACYAECELFCEQGESFVAAETSQPLIDRLAEREERRSDETSDLIDTTDPVTVEESSESASSTESTSESETIVEAIQEVCGQQVVFRPDLGWQLDGIIVNGSWLPYTGEPTEDEINSHYQWLFPGSEWEIAQNDDGRIALRQRGVVPGMTSVSIHRIGQPSSEILFWRTHCKQVRPDGSDVSEAPVEETVAEEVCLFETAELCMADCTSE